MPRIRVRLLRNTTIDGRIVYKDNREIVTQDEADFLILRGYARPEPIKPRKSKRGKPGHVDKKQIVIEKLLAGGDGDCVVANADRDPGKLQATERKAAGVKEAAPAPAAAAEAVI